MKLSPEDKKLMEMMAPGALTRDGFLGVDKRPIGEMIDGDRSSVEGLGLTNERIAARLDEVLRKAIAAMGAPVKIANDLEAVYFESRGRAPCPWGDGNFDKGHVELKNTHTGRKFLISPIGIHMIAAHGFYQGRGSPFHLDPNEITEILLDISKNAQCAGFRARTSKK